MNSGKDARCVALNQALVYARDLFISGKSRSLVAAILRAAADNGVDAVHLIRLVRSAIRDGDGEDWRRQAISRAVKNECQAAPAT